METFDVPKSVQIINFEEKSPSRTISLADEIFGNGNDGVKYSKNSPGKRYSINEFGRTVPTYGVTGPAANRISAKQLILQSQKHLNSELEPANSSMNNSIPEDCVAKKKKGQRGDKSGKGLRHFSVKVCEKVERKGRTTYNEVADELVAEFTQASEGGSSNSEQYEEKNIRRRVYDALNVLMAMNIIAKEKKEIHWRGLPKGETSNTEKFRADLQEVRSRVTKKEAELNELNEQISGLQRLVQRNEESGRRNGAEQNSGVYLPFILVQTQSQATVEVMISEDMQMVNFDFNNTPFELHDDSYVLRAMGMYDRSGLAQTRVQTELFGTRARPRASIVRSIEGSLSPSIIKARPKAEPL